ncbi:helicase-related protein [Streptomyces flaveolus]|uniref:helicase-related protein n=1 Tax=Streptomyces flaveolus TaxID=67297 RepID=UPI0036B3A4D9
MQAHACCTAHTAPAFDARRANPHQCRLRQEPRRSWRPSEQPLHDRRRSARRPSPAAGPSASGLVRRRKSDPGIAPSCPARSTTTHRRSHRRADRPAPDLQHAHPLPQGTPGRRRATGLARRSDKLATLDELAAILADRGEAALVFTGYVQMGRILGHHLRDRGRSVRLLHGGTPSARRQHLVDAFQPDPAPVFILSVKAADTCRGSGHRPRPPHRTAPHRPRPPPDH